MCCFRNYNFWNRCRLCAPILQKWPGKRKQYFSLSGQAKVGRKKCQYDHCWELSLFLKAPEVSSNFRHEAVYRFEKMKKPDLTTRHTPVYSWRIKTRIENIFHSNLRVLTHKNTRNRCHLFHLLQTTQFNCSNIFTNGKFCTNRVSSVWLKIFCDIFCDFYFCDILKIYFS